MGVTSITVFSCLIAAATRVRGLERRLRHTTWFAPFFLPVCLTCTTCSSADNCETDHIGDVVDFVFEPPVTQTGDYVVSIDSPPVNGSCHVIVGATTLEPCSSARMRVYALTDEGVVALSSLRVWFDYAPPTITLTIEQGEDILVSQQYEPDYVYESKEGNSCQSRLHASIPVELPREE